MSANNYSRQTDEPLADYEDRLRALGAAEKANARLKLPASQMTPQERAERLDELLKPTPLHSGNPADRKPKADERLAFTLNAAQRREYLQSLGVHGI